MKISSFKNWPPVRWARKSPWLAGFSAFALLMMVCYVCALLQTSSPDGAQAENLPKVGMVTDLSNMTAADKRAAMAAKPVTWTPPAKPAAPSGN